MKLNKKFLVTMGAACAGMCLLFQNFSAQTSSSNGVYSQFTLVGGTALKYGSTILQMTDDGDLQLITAGKTYWDTGTGGRKCEGRCTASFALGSLKLSGKNGNQYWPTSGTVPAVGPNGTSQLTLLSTAPYLKIANIDNVQWAPPIPIHISSRQDLDNVRYFLSGHYVLDNDLDLGNTYFESIAAPAGQNAPYLSNDQCFSWYSSYGSGIFTGTFDGNGKTISNVNSTYGLFKASAGTINRLHIQNVTFATSVNNDYAAVGGLVGNVVYVNAQYPGIVADSYTDGTLSIPGGMRAEALGGLVGMLGGGVVSNSHSALSIVDQKGIARAYFTGGLIGEQKDGKVTASYASGDILSKFLGHAGGLIGGTVPLPSCYSPYRSVEGASYATGRVNNTGSKYYLGSLIGICGADGTRGQGNFKVSSNSVGHASGLPQFGENWDCARF